MKFETQYTGYVGQGTVNDMEDKAHQSFKDEVDVNKIIKRFRNARQQLPARKLQYMDVSGLRDFSHAMEIVDTAKEVFMDLPAEVRAYFKHEPARFIDYTANHSDQEVWDLVNGPPQEAPVDPAPTPPDPASAPAGGSDPAPASPDPAGGS